MESKRRWRIVLERKTQNRLNVDITKRKLKRIAEAAERNKSLGFRAKVGKFNEPELVFDDELKTDIYHYRVNIYVVKPKVNNPETVEQKFEHVLKVITKCANAQEFNIVSSGPFSHELKEADVKKLEAPSWLSKPIFTLPALTDEVLSTHFAGIYERTDQIKELYGAIQTHIETGGKVANHALLYGQPGSCKTVLTERLKTWFDTKGSTTPYEWVRFIDGTTVTKAGAENWFKSLAEGDDVPIVLVLDEIEKNEKSWLLGLLSIMSSGIVTKLNAWTGNSRLNFSPYIIGICNDENSLREFKNEALWSRFTHEIYCPRPSRELASLILTDLASLIPDSDPAWAEEALNFGWDKLQERDIRKLKAHLDARHRLLDGSWQTTKLRMKEIEKREKEQILRERERRIN